MKHIVIGCISAFVFGCFFHIHIPGIVCLEGITFFLAFCWSRMVKREAEKRRDFLEITEYMQSMGMSFLISGTEYPALTETMSLFEKSKIRLILQEAIRRMEESYDGKAGERAFSYIEEHYSCKKLRLFHHYMLMASKIGGRYQNGIRILLRDLELWKKRQLMFYEELAADKRKIYVATLLTVLLCGYVTSLSGNKIDITNGLVYQIGMVVFWCGCMGVCVLGQIWGRMDWFEEKETYSPEEIQNKLLRHKKETLHHRIGYQTRKKILCQELAKAFPEWMLEVALRIESKNVEVALQESYTNAPAIIRPYLGTLLADLKTYPGQAEPYFAFASDLHNVEVTTSMKLLYGISKGKVLDGKDHIKELIERNYQMESLIGAQRMEKKRSVMYGCSFLPSLLGAGCMILTMSLLLIGFVGNLRL